MAHTKDRNPKHKKNHKAAKQHGKQVDITQLRAQLDALGLQIIQVTADGNCFFRAIADQLEGNEEEHEKYRQMVVQYIKTHRGDFEPFIEDELPFDEYCQNMEKDGTWAGHMELQAASLVTRTNICIHRAMSPRWYIRNFGDKESSMIHLSYHDGEHYNSVRLKEDPCEGPAGPIIIKVDANLSVLNHNQKTKAYEERGSSCRSFFNAGSVKVVMASTGCENLSKIEQVLQGFGGDVDAAIEFLIAEQQSYEHADAICSEKKEYNQEKSCEEPEVGEEGIISEQLDLASKDSINVEIAPKNDSQNTVHDDKRIRRNKEHPSQSKKNYKASCGSGERKPSAVATVSNTSKNRKDAKMQRKKNDFRTASDGVLEETPDLGALCI